MPPASAAMWAALALLNLALASLVLSVPPRRAVHALVAGLAGANAAFGLDAALRAAGALQGPPPDLVASAYGVAAAALAVAFLAVPVALVVLRSRGTDRGGWPARDAAELLLFLAVGAVLGLNLVPDPASHLVVRPILLAYAVFRFGPAPLDLARARPLAAVAMLGAAGGAYFLASASLAEQGFGPDAGVGLGLVAAGAGALLAWPLVRLTLGTPEAVSTERARDLYREALREAVAAASGDTTSNDRVLAALRRRLRISEREHAVLEAEARALSGAGGEAGVGKLFLGRYRIEALLGEGGFARTYLAQDERLGRRVVLKIARWTRPEETKRALREGRILAALAHPGIVAIHDVEEVAGEVVLVLEYVPGGSLADALRKGPVPLDGALAILDHVLAALDAAHAKGVVHRDVKPSNVLLAADGRAKLADFGIASARGVSATVTGSSFTKEGAGTLRYMSPEQARGLEAGARSDVYAAGVVLYELLAGVPYLPLEGLAEFEVRRAILEEEPRLPLPGVPPAVNEALRRALAKDAAERPQSAGELRRLLTASRGR